MNRLIAILLIPFFAVGNSLAHSHCTTAHPSQGKDRAHFHVGSSFHHHDHHHHDHGHDAPTSTLIERFDHDADAVYIVAVDSPYTKSNRSVDSGAPFIPAAESSSFSIVSAPRCIQPPAFLRTTELPLYLLQAVLRL